MLKVVLHFRPYYELKAHFNHLLESQKSKVQNLEAQVTNAKLTYADALRNLEQISDEIHQTRNRTSAIAATLKQASTESNNSSLDDIPDFRNDYKTLPEKFSPNSSPLCVKNDSNSVCFQSDDAEIDGFGNSSVSPQLETFENHSLNHSVTQSHSSEWTEINLDVSSPEEERENRVEADRKPKLLKQKTLPNPTIENEFSSIKSKIKLDANISNWISRSSAKSDANCLGSSKYYYLLA